MMTSAQVVETSVTVTNNSPSRDYSHADDQTTQTTETPGFKPFTIIKIRRITRVFILLYLTRRVSSCTCFSRHFCGLINEEISNVALEKKSNF